MENLDIVETCDNYNGYPSGFRKALTGFADFSAAEKAAKECGGEVVHLSRRDGLDLWTRCGWMAEPFQFSGDMFGDDYEVFDNAGAYWDFSAVALADILNGGIDLDGFAEMVKQVQDTRDALEDLDEGNAVLCRNDGGVYVYVQTLDNMDYTFDVCRHIVAVLPKE